MFLKLLIYFPIVLLEVILLSGCDHPYSITNLEVANSSTANIGESSLILVLSCSLRFSVAVLVEKRPPIPASPSTMSKDINDKNGWNGSSTRASSRETISSSSENKDETVPRIDPTELFSELILAFTIVCGAVNKFM